LELAVSETCPHPGLLLFNDGKVAMGASGDFDALRKTASLMDFLAEVTDAVERDPIRDILSDEWGAPSPLVWLDDLPDGTRVSPHAADGVLLRVRPPRSAPEPRPPEQVSGWLDDEEPRGFDGPEPSLLERGPVGLEPSEMSEPPNSVVRAFTKWLAEWRRWAEEQKRSQRRRHLYEALEKAAKTMEQQDDEYEFVLAVGLVCWDNPGDESIRRHLVTEPVLPQLDRSTAEVTVSLVGGKRRFEDREVFGDLAAYQPERGRAARQVLLDSEAPLLDPQTMVQVQEWLGVGFAEAFETAKRRVDRVERLPRTPALSASPALLLRPRSRVLLAEAYKRIAEALREPDAQVPVALAQLVLDTEQHQRDLWLREQGAATGDVLGCDPLFPLPTNDEQMRVIDLLRTETGVVVQGPPGTGKTHTIANLVSALLARGQRVLVTSQKDQALKVLRDKIPAPLRRLCVLLAGGSKDAAKELEQGLDALSEAIAAPSTASLRAQAEELAAERHELRSRSAHLNDRIRTLRDLDTVEHDPVVPGYSTDAYHGTLPQIVREVQRNAASHDWIPPVDPQRPDVPPLPAPDLVELLRLIRTDTPNRRLRADQDIPDRGDLPGVDELTEILVSERHARATAHEDTSELTQRLAGVGASALQELLGLRDEAKSVLRRLGFGDDCVSPPAVNWVARAVGDRLAGRHAGLWGHLFEVRNEASRLQERLQAQGVTFAIELPSIRELGVGTARGLLNAGRQLRDHLARGKKLRKVLPSAAQKDATALLEIVRVDGQSPRTLPQLEAALERLEAEVAAAQLAEKWADAGVEISADRLTLTLSELHDHARVLDQIETALRLHAEVSARLERMALPVDLSTVTGFVALLDAVPAALKYVELEHARTQVDELHSKVRRWAASPHACPELGLLLQAIRDRDLDGYRSGLQAVDLARAERADEQRRAQLARTLHGVHPALFDLLQRTSTDPAWDTRLPALPAAWAWSKAEQFMQRQRNADEERRLAAEFDQVEDRIKRVTERLAAAEAIQACVERMSDTHAAALRSYREHMSHVGAGTGAKTREYRKAARAAMEKAKDAVPAWVVPLPNLLDNIAPHRNTFDVVIVDEASQVGVEHLYLLWMAPRVIVVGDHKQCTPGGNRMGRLEDVFNRLNDHLNEIDAEIRMVFNPKANLYGMLSARSGKDAVVRLREHFRCMPEIISWSSSQFYGEHDRPGLVPLRERTADHLAPLRVVHVTGAYTEGRDTKRRNPVEAKRIVDQLVQCLADSQYQGKTFGVVVLQGTGQVKLLEHEINSAITPEQRADRQIRVGTAPDFQGDERDVIFLSMVVAEPPRAQYQQRAQQAYNVAASRAKDQMWLFTSVRLDQLKPGDLRGSLMGYMLNPPSVFGDSPDLESVSATQPCDPFESLLEQRVFRAIKQRGYHVVPQHKVGPRALDLVVVGDGGRLAVECDGHRWHTSTTQQISDARRDRELRRMGWEVVRIRESEFEFDGERELAPLWQRLEQRQIHPRDARTGHTSGWAPIDLPEDDEDGQETEL
jgi:very-short-patch-repair endonuclease